MSFNSIITKPCECHGNAIHAETTSILKLLIGAHKLKYFIVHEQGHSRNYASTKLPQTHSTTTNKASLPLTAAAKLKSNLIKIELHAYSGENSPVTIKRYLLHDTVDEKHPLQS